LNRIRRVLSVLLIAALFVGLAVPASVSAYVEPGTIIPDGQYTVSFRYVKDGTTETSAADTFLVKDSGRLVVSNGKSVFEHEIKKASYATFAYLAARKTGAAKAVIHTVNDVESVTGQEGYEAVAVRDAENPDNVVVQFVIEDIWKKQDILMHIDDKDNIYGLPIPYKHWYTAQLEINTSDITLPDHPGGGEEEPPVTGLTEQLFVQRVAEGYALYDDAVEGDYDGTYPAGSKQMLLGKLELAESLIKEEPGNLKAAYQVVDQAIKAFEASRIAVDKSRLVQWIETASAWVAGKADAGEREAGLPSNRAALSDGEYLPLDYFGPAVGYKGPVTKIKEQIAQALLLVDKENATQAEVNGAYNTANAAGDWALFEKQRVTAQDIEILVLDSLEKDAKLSPYANEISTHAVLLQQAGPDYYHAYANIAFYDQKDELTDRSIRTMSISAADGLFSRWSSTSALTVKQPDVTNTTAFANVLSGEHKDTIKVYQTEVRSSNRTYIQNDELWQGLWALQYPMELSEEERHTVFISFNKAYLDALQQLIDDAHILLDTAEEGTALGQHSAYHITRLEAAIATAQATADQLSAPRPQILEATKALHAAVDTFQAAQTKQVYFSVAHSSDEAFSRMEQYFEKPAIVATDDQGTMHVSFTVTSSSSVPELNVKTGNQFVAAATVSENKENDTRVVEFKVDDLSSLLDAQVRTVVPAMNYDRTHSIRLNFNGADNEELYDLILEATDAYDKAVEREQAGEYYEIARTALANAIKLAHEEAVRFPSDQETTDAAYQRLSKALETFKTVYEDDPGTGNPGPNPGTPSPGTPSPGDPVYPADGNYYVPFTIYKNGTTQQSVAQDYVVPTALVKVTGNSKTVSFTVLRSKEITGLTIGGSSGSIAHSDTALNQRVVSFNLSNLSSSINGWVKVDWPEFNYHNSYDIQFKFHEAQASNAGINPSVPGSSHVPSAPNLPNPGSVNEEEQEEVKTDEEKPKQSDDNAQSGQQAGSNSGTATVAFSDAANHWAKASIEKAIKLGIVNGYADGSFRPNGTVTRGEFAVMLSRALKLEESSEVNTLTDITSIPGWAKVHVARVVSEGLIQGYADSTFRTNDQLTRAQLAVIVARAAKLDVDAAGALQFSDAAQVPGWAQKEVAAAVKAGLIVGKKNNRFDANGTATRAEALTLIIRLLEKAGT